MIWIFSLVPALLVALLMFYLGRAQKKKDIAMEARAEVRKEESLLLLRLNAATAKMASAAAEELKNGTNSETVEEAIAELDAVCDAYTDFMNRQAKAYMYK